MNCKNSLQEEKNTKYKSKNQAWARLGSFQPGNFSHTILAYVLRKVVDKRPTTDQGPYHTGNSHRPHIWTGVGKGKQEQCCNSQYCFFCTDFFLKITKNVFVVVLAKKLLPWQTKEPNLNLKFAHDICVLKTSQHLLYLPIEMSYLHVFL